MEQKRSSFTGKIGFVLAAAGSAVGLGNIWRFPYLAAKYGGGIFLLVYVLLAVTFGFAIMVAEIAIGRKTGLSVVGAYGKLNKKFKFLGYLAAIVPIIILPYYSVIGGWVTKYLGAYVTGGIAAADAESYFTAFTSQTWQPILWFAIFIGLSYLVVMFGVEKGVEKVSKILMPILVILTLGIAIYTVCLPGAGAGIAYYLKPDFSKFSFKSIVVAMGQLFYSMSLAMGIMVTYGSYMKKDVGIVSSVRQIEVFDTGIAFLAGLMIVPAVFVFSGGSEEALNKGASLMFITLPKVFDSMPGGTIIGAVFFLLVLFAALTSAISLMETVVSIFVDRFHWNRRWTCTLVMIGCLLMGLPSTLGFGVWGNVKPLGMSFLDFFDFVSNSVLMPIVAFLTCIFVGYVIKPRALIDEVRLNNRRFREEKAFSVIIRYVAPVFTIMILVASVAEALGFMKV